MIKVLIIIPTLYGGGAEKNARYLYKFLSSSEYQVQIVTFSEYSRDFDVVQIEPDNWLTVNLAIFRLIFRYNSLKKVKLNFEPNISISFLPMANLLNILTRKTESVACSIRNNPKMGANRLFKWIVYKSCLIFSGKVVMPSMGLPSKLDLFFFRKKILFIRNPLEIKTNMFSRNHLSSDQLKFRIVMIGSLTTQKNHIAAIRVMKYLQEFVPLLKLEIRGVGKLNNHLVNKIKDFDLTEKVVLAGFVDNNHNSIDNFDIVLHLSQYEGMPNALIEAIENGVDLISTDCRFGPRELIANINDYKKELNYPYIGEYGILIDKIKSNNRLELNNEEKSLASILIDYYCHSSSKFPFNRSIDHLSDFEIHNVRYNWIQIVKGSVLK